MINLRVNERQAAEDMGIAFQAMGLNKKREAEKELPLDEFDKLSLKKLKPEQLFTPVHHDLDFKRTHVVKYGGRKPQYVKIESPHFELRGTVPTTKGKRGHVFKLATNCPMFVAMLLTWCTSKDLLQEIATADLTTFANLVRFHIGHQGDITLFHTDEEVCNNEKVYLHIEKANDLIGKIDRLLKRSSHPIFVRQDKKAYIVDREEGEFYFGRNPIEGTAFQIEKEDFIANLSFGGSEVSPVEAVCFFKEETPQKPVKLIRV